MSTKTAPVAPAKTNVAPLPLSTLSSKYWMAITGLLLVGFLFVHMAGNLLVYKGQDALNAYGKFLKDQGPLLWVARFGLLAIFVVHVVLAFRLTRRNRQARPIPYQVSRTLRASTPSKFMWLTGLVILAFVIFHIAHYTLGIIHQVPVKNPLTGNEVQKDMLSLLDSKGRHDVYGMVILAFRQPIISVLYIVAQLLLAFHLYHGASSMFQSLGVNHSRYNWLFQKFGLVVALIIGIGNISMPLTIMLGLVGQGYQPLY